MNNILKIPNLLELIVIKQNVKANNRSIHFYLKHE